MDFDRNQTGLTIAQLTFMTRLPEISKKIWYADNGHPLIPVTSDFKTKLEQSDQYGWLNRKDESIYPNLMGVIVEMMTRFFTVCDGYLFNDRVEVCFDNAHQGALASGLEPLFNEQLDYLEALLVNGKQPRNRDSYLKMVNIFLMLAHFEQVYRGSAMQVDYGAVDWPTARHLNIMCHRAKCFLNRIEMPTTIDYNVTANNGILFGDGDFLNHDYLIDFKTYSSDPNKAIENRRQMALYYALGRFAKPVEYSEFNTLSKVTMYNPRSDRSFTWQVNVNDMQVLYNNVLKYVPELLKEMKAQAGEKDD